MNSLRTGARAQHDEQRKALFNVESRIGSMLKSGYADSRETAVELSHG
jgi:hypothetical protein